MWQIMFYFTVTSYIEIYLLHVREVTELCADEQTNIHIRDVLVHPHRIWKILFRTHNHR